MGKKDNNNDNVTDIDKWADKKNEENDKLAKELGLPNADNDKKGKK